MNAGTEPGPMHILKYLLMALLIGASAPLASTLSFHCEHMADEDVNSCCDHAPSACPTSAGDCARICAAAIIPHAVLIVELIGNSSAPEANASAMHSISSKPEAPPPRTVGKFQFQFFGELT